MTDTDRLDWLARRLDPSMNYPYENALSFVSNLGNTFTDEIGRTCDSGTWLRLAIDEIRRNEKDEENHVSISIG